jgi:molybdopterin biosynthesis enzyme
MAVGDKVLSAGDTVGPAEVGLLASVGAIRPRVTPQVLPPSLPPSCAAVMALL